MPSTPAPSSDAPALVLRSFAEDSALPRLMPRSSRPRRERSRGVKRGAWLALAGIFGVLLLALTGGITASSPDSASARSGTDFVCGWYDLGPSDVGQFPAKVQPWPGVAGLFGDAVNVVSGSGPGLMDFNTLQGLYTQYTTTYESQKVTPTAYEWFGTAGLTWQVMPFHEYSDCPIVLQGLTSIPTVIFGINQLVVVVGLQLFNWVTTINAFDPFLGVIASVAEAMKQALLLNYITPIVMLAALYVGWQGLVKKRSTEALQSVVWTLCACAAAIAFLNAPTWVAQKVNNTVNLVGTSILNGVATAATFGGKTDQSLSANPCYLPTLRIADKDPTPGDTALQYGSRTAACDIWAVFLFAPWSTGTFGPYATQDLGTEGDAGKVPSVSIPGHDDNRNMALVWLNATVLNHDQVITSATDPQAFGDALVEKRQVQFDFVRAVLPVEQGTDTPTQYAAMKPYFSGEQWAGRTTLSLVALAATIIGVIPLLFLAFMLLLLQISFVFILLVAPLFLTLGIHPGIGRKVALGWVELVLANAIKRIGTMAMLAIMLAVFVGIVRAGGSWFIQVMMLGGTGIAVLLYRGRFLSMLTSFDLNGMGTRGLGSEWTRAGSKVTSEASNLGRSGMSKWGEGGSFLTGLAVGAIDRRALGLPGAAMGAKKRRADKAKAEETNAQSVAEASARREQEDQHRTASKDRSEKMVDLLQKIYDQGQRAEAGAEAGGVLACAACGSALVTAADRQRGKHGSCTAAGSGAGQQLDLPFDVDTQQLELDFEDAARRSASSGSGTGEQLDLPFDVAPQQQTLPFAGDAGTVPAAAVTVPVAPVAVPVAPVTVPVGTATAPAAPVTVPVAPAATGSGEPAHPSGAPTPVVVEPGNSTEDAALVPRSDKTVKLLQEIRDQGERQGPERPKPPAAGDGG